MTSFQSAVIPDDALAPQWLFLSILRRKKIRNGIYILILIYVLRRPLYLFLVAILWLENERVSMPVDNNNGVVVVVGNRNAQPTTMSIGPRAFPSSGCSTLHLEFSAATTCTMRRHYAGRQKRVGTRGGGKLEQILRDSISSKRPWRVLSLPTLLV